METTTVDYWADTSCGLWNKGRNEWTSHFDKVFHNLCGGSFVACHWKMGTDLQKYHAWAQRIVPEVAAQSFYNDIMSQPRNVERKDALQKEQAMLDSVPVNAGFNLFYKNGYWLVSESSYDTKPTQKAKDLASAAGFNLTRYGYILIDGKRVKKVR